MPGHVPRSPEAVPEPPEAISAPRRLIITLPGGSPYGYAEGCQLTNGVIVASWFDPPQLYVWRDLDELREEWPDAELTWLDEDLPAAGTPTDTCGASARTGVGRPTPFIGPCVLRAHHDGPVHQDADGAQWTDPRPATAEDSAALCPPTGDLHERLRQAAYGLILIAVPGKGLTDDQAAEVSAAAHLMMRACAQLEFARTA
ncbi:hypothetical protein [Actinomadura geliboluensis]|uniref:hypothetical protein n=1 Tax=Actinomadura geliboluensis TaxID=882440 RepID=UPI003694DA83